MKKTGWVLMLHSCRRGSGFNFPIGHLPGTAKTLGMMPDYNLDHEADIRSSDFFFWGGNRISDRVGEMVVQGGCGIFIRFYQMER